MNDRKATGPVILALLLALAVGAGVAAALWHPGQGVSYTGSAANPSPSKAALTAIPPDRRKPAPEIAFADAQGRPMTVKDLAGKVVLMNLWATWCPPCVAEMPALDRLNTSLGRADFVVVAVSLDRGGAPVAQRWLDRAGLTLPVHTADSADFQGGVLPTSYLIDVKGRIAWEGSGARQWDGEEAAAMVRAVMAEKD